MLIFPGDNISWPESETLAKAFLLLLLLHLLPQARILGARAAYADSKVNSGSRGSHGVNGCPGSGFDVRLQPWPWKRVLRRVSPTAGIAQPRGAAAAEQSPVQPCWSRQQAGLAAGPSPKRRLPPDLCLGQPLPFLPPHNFPLFLPLSPAASSRRNLCLAPPAIAPWEPVLAVTLRG